MTLLLSAHVLVQAAGLPDSQSEDTLTLLKYPHTELLYAAASLWEVAIWGAVGRVM